MGLKKRNNSDLQLLEVLLFASPLAVSNAVSTKRSAQEPAMAEGSKDLCRALKRRTGDDQLQSLHTENRMEYRLVR